MRIALFDWVCGGHHELYVRRFAEALRGHVDVVVAAPDDTLAAIKDLDLDRISLGSPRPAASATAAGRGRRWRLLEEEARLFADAGRAADLALHLHADAVLPHLIKRRANETPSALLVFYPRAHYPSAFGTPLKVGERARAHAREALVAAWRRRRDAAGLLTLDEEAARRWAIGRGAPAHWIPEPPVAPAGEIAVAERRGCVVYGAIGPRKGIDLLARAVSLEATPVEITIAGEVIEAFGPRLRAHVAEMRRGGATVVVRAERHDEAAGLRALAGARCALLAYECQYGMSRVLLEACFVGTPVIVHDRGLIGHLVKRYGLGRAVDCRNPRAFRAAILELTRDGVPESFTEPLAAFARRYSPAEFENALLSSLRIFESSAPEGRSVLVRGAA